MTYLIEISGGGSMFGGMPPQMRVMDDKYIERMRWTKIRTKSGKEVLIDDEGSVEAIIVDEIPAVEAAAIRRTEGSYL